MENEGNMLPKVLSIIGPTASGKTDLAIQLAQEFNGEIICVDSRTVYRGMDIGTAKPEGERVMEGTWKIGDVPLTVEGIAHWGLDLIDPGEDYSIADFKGYAEKKIDEILKRGKLPILVGGTGLWMDAITKNLSLPEVPPDPELRKQLEAKTTEELFKEFEKLDPTGAEEIDQFNKRRLIRALEVCKKTGRPFSELRQVGEPKYDVLKLGIEVDREVLRQRIDARVDQMIVNGLVDEVRNLKEEYGCDAPSMTGIGYRQICFFLENKANLEMAILDIKKDTWQFARRQFTWFRRDASIQWVRGIDEARAMISPWLQA